MLHASGVPVDGEPRSVPSHTVLDRLPHVVAGFDKERQNDAKVLLTMRNLELHTGDATLASVRVERWLPIFQRVAEPLCAHLDVALEDLVGDQIAQLGRSLVDQADKRLAHEISQRIEAATAFFNNLTGTEIAARKPSLESVRSNVQVVACPSCDIDAALTLDLVRTTDERVEDDHFVSERLFVATDLACPVCNLVLAGTAEIKAAGLPQHFTRAQSESFYDRMMEEYMADDYGND
jgi:hypothetical protein